MFVPRKIIKDTSIRKLRRKSNLVSFPLSDEINDLCSYMIEHLQTSQDEEANKQYHLRPGVGIAACQLDKLYTIFALYIKYEDRVVKHVFINPKIIATSLKKAYLASGEGCLSIDVDRHGIIVRNYTTTIKAYDYLLQTEVEIKFKGYESIVVQHEIDHFAGILYFDHIDKQNPDFKPQDALEIN